MKVITKETISRHNLRQFGLGLGLLLSLIGSALLWRGQPVGWVVFLPGPALALACWYDWPGMRRFYVVWMKLSLVMARVMTTILLIMLFILLLTPISLLARLCGHKFVVRGFGTGETSCWVPRSRNGSGKSYEKQS